MARQTYLVPFLPGNGTEVMLTVTYISEFPRDVRGLCAFCHGDPCAETSPPESHIARYMAEREATFTSYDWGPDSWPPLTCPLCEGRPS